MAEGWGVAAANSTLDTISAAYPWLKLHVGAPGAAGTTSPATETTRKQITYAAANVGTITSNAQVQWTNVAGTETYSKCTFWTASSAGTFGFSGLVTANPVTAGDTFTINSGDVDMALTLAS